jgi:hypothetical protein
MMNVKRAAYLYNGWHPCAERDAECGAGWTEWELLKKARLGGGATAAGMPRGGPYDDRDPATWDARIETATRHGVDVLVSGWFWSRGKKVFHEALERGYLGAERRDEASFAVFWANRMPHRVLPLRAADPEGPDPRRLVHADPADFVALVQDLGDRFFARPNYWRPAGLPYFAIYDTTLFLRQLGPARAAEAIARAKDRVGGLFLAAIDPDVPWRPLLRELGFDAVTHYVHLPVWKGGPREQEYDALVARREAEWPRWPVECGLPYFPSCARGWDARPRGVWHANASPDRFPWAPIVVGATPEKFGAHVAAAERFARTQRRTADGRALEPAVFLASWNEWTEGHALEPSEEHGEAWLAALPRDER